MKPFTALSFGCMFGLSPYLLWFFKGPHQSYAYSITYLPIFVWIIALTSFWIGTRRFSRKSAILEINPKQYSNKKVKNLIYFLFVFQCFLLIISVVELGYLPILKFFSGININEVNDDLQDSSFGLYGLIVINCILLTNFLCILQHLSEKLSFLFKFIFVSSVIVVLVSSIFLGKRQLLIIILTVVFINIYFSLKAKRNLLNMGLLPLFIMLFLIIFLVGIIADLRNNNINESLNYFESGFFEILNYLSLPLINFEAQFENSNFFGEFRNLSPVLSQLIPYKFLGSALILPDQPPAPEPTIGSGMLGILHWNLGLLFIPIIYYLYGKFISLIYQKARNNFAYRSIYGLAFWSLIASHTYIHLFSLVFFWAPILVIYILTKLIEIKNKNNSNIDRI